MGLGMIIILIHIFDLKKYYLVFLIKRTVFFKSLIQLRTKNIICISCLFKVRPKKANMRIKTGFLLLSKWKGSSDDSMSTYSNHKAVSWTLSTFLKSVNPSSVQFFCGFYATDAIYYFFLIVDRLPLSVLLCKQPKVLKFFLGHLELNRNW